MTDAGMLIMPVGSLHPCRDEVGAGGLVFHGPSGPFRRAFLCGVVACGGPNPGTVNRLIVSPRQGDRVRQQYHCEDNGQTKDTNAEETTHPLNLSGQCALRNMRIRGHKKRINVEFCTYAISERYKRINMNRLRCKYNNLSC